MSPSLTSSATHDVASCNRRLSRAAEQVLMEQVAPVLENYLSEQGKPLPTRKTAASTRQLPKQAVSLRDSYLWDLLDRTAVSSCPLLNDLYKDFEEQSLKSRVLSSKFTPRTTYPSWFHCGICGKMFTSRYYLDAHQQHHKHDIADSGSCLATTVCEALGGCEQVALDAEPHYGPGSGAGGPDAKQVQRTWASQIQPCNEDVVQNIMRPNCKKLVSDCFLQEEGALNDELQTSLCQSLSCHALLHRQEYMHRHYAKSLWNEMMEEGYSQWRAMAVMIFLLIYFVAVVGCGERGSHGGARGLGKAKGRPLWPWRKARTKKKLL